MSEGEHAGGVDAQLRRVAEYEAGLRRNKVTAFLMRAGRSPLFARLYPKLGRRIDPVLYRRTQGRAATRLYGLPVLLLSCTGARSGLPRTATLVYVRDGDAFVVVGTNFGGRSHPAWTENLIAHPRCAVQVGPERISVVAVLAGQADWDRLWKKFLAVYPGYADYLARSGRRPRIFVLSPER